MFRDDPDPWGFHSRWEEFRRQQLCLAILDRQRFRSAFEPGCANGAFTTLLADRCGTLLASDGAPSAVSQAKMTTSTHSNVQICVQEMPLDWPPGRFELIVLKDFLYYLDKADIAEMAVRALSSIDSDGRVLVAHWLGHADDFETPADQIHAVFAEVFELSPLATFTDETQMIELWSSATLEDNR